MNEGAFPYVPTAYIAGATGSNTSAAFDSNPFSTARSSTGGGREPYLSPSRASSRAAAAPKVASLNCDHPFEPLNKELHLQVLRYGPTPIYGFQENVEKVHIYDPPHITPYETTVGGGTRAVSKDHLNSVVLLKSRVLGGRVRRSKVTVEEGKIHLIDDNARTIEQKLKQEPPKRPYRAANENDNAKEEDEAGDFRLKNVDQINVQELVVKLVPRPHDVKSEVESAESLRKTLDMSRTVELPAGEAPTPFEKTQEVSQQAVVSTTTSSARQGATTDIRRLTSFKLEAPLPELDYEQFAWLPTELSEGLQLPEPLYLKISNYQRRPKSAPINAYGGRKKQQFNQFYFESLMMASARPLRLPKVCVEPVDALFHTVSQANIKRVTGPLHFGYDANGNLVSIVARGNQAIVRPKTASAIPESERETDAFLVNILNEDQKIGSRTQRVLKSEARKAEKDAAKSAAKLAHQAAKGNDDTGPMMTDGGDGSPGSSPGKSPLGGSPLRPLSPASPAGLAPGSRPGSALLPYHGASAEDLHRHGHEGHVGHHHDAAHPHHQQHHHYYEGQEDHHPDEAHPYAYDPSKQGGSSSLTLPKRERTYADTIAYTDDWPLLERPRPGDPDYDRRLQERPVNPLMSRSLQEIAGVDTSSLKKLNAMGSTGHNHNPNAQHLDSTGKMDVVNKTKWTSNTNNMDTLYNERHRYNADGSLNIHNKRNYEDGLLEVDLSKFRETCDAAEEGDEGSTGGGSMATFESSETEATAIGMTTQEANILYNRTSNPRYMPRSKVRVPIYEIVEKPLLDIKRNVDIQLYNEIDKSPISATTLAIENKSLVGFFRATQGENWVRKDNWLDFSVPKEQWYGITMDSRGYIVEIRLTKNNLVGEFPTDLGRLKELEVLNLDHNHLTGEIVEATLNNFEQLEVLSLRDNEFTGEIPFRVFSLMPKIREVWLSENKLTGEIHKNIGNVRNLTHFDVYHNLLTGIIPPEVGKCEKLEVFSVGHNKLTGEIPDEMRGCHRLTYMSMYTNKLSGTIPTWVQELQGLLELNLNFNDFTGYVPKSAKEMYAKKQRRLERALRITNEHRVTTREKSRQYEERKHDIAAEQEREHAEMMRIRQKMNMQADADAAKGSEHPGQIDDKLAEERTRVRTANRMTQKQILMDLERQEVNTAASTDEGYEYIRTVSRLGRDMGPDGLGLNKAPPADPLVPQYILDQGVVMENWRTGSRQRKMATLLGGEREIRMHIESTLPPAERKPQERRLRRELREKEEQEQWEAATAVRVATAEAEHKRIFGTTVGFDQEKARTQTTVSHDANTNASIVYHTTVPGNTQVNNYNTMVDLTTGRNTWEPSSPTLPYVSRRYRSGEALRRTPPKEPTPEKEHVRTRRSQYSKKRLHAMTNSNKLRTNDGNPFKDKTLSHSPPPLTSAALSLHGKRTAGSDTGSLTGMHPDDKSDDGYTYASEDTDDTGLVLAAAHKVNTDVVDKMSYRW